MRKNKRHSLGECRLQDFFLTVEPLRSRVVPTLPDILRPLQSYGYFTKIPNNIDFLHLYVDKMIKNMDKTKRARITANPSDVLISK
jgi:hypothetical protein